MTQEHRRSRRPGTIDDRLWGLNPLVVSGCRLWFRANTLALNDNDPVVTWPDESGLGTNAVSPDGSRPTFKTNIVNGLPVVRFDGAQGLDHGLLTLATATYFIVWSRVNAGNSDYVLGKDGSAYSYLQYGGDWYTAAAGNMAVAMAANTFMLKCCVYNGATHQRYTNGTAHSSMNSVAGASLKVIGGLGYACRGDIAELLVYSRALTDSERQRVEACLNAKYALW